MRIEPNSLVALPSGNWVRLQRRSRLGGWNCVYTRLAGRTPRTQSLYSDLLLRDDFLQRFGAPVLLGQGA